MSPHRTKRPWLGHTEPPQSVDIPEYDATCYLCPRNTRTSGHRNPDYTETYVFENDFAAVLPPPLPEVTPPAHPLMTAEPVHGACDVVLFHPKHNLTMSRMSVEEIERVIEEWVRIYEKRGSEPGIRYVQIFEVCWSLLHGNIIIELKSEKQNKGSIMGCSNPHPHGQVWSISAVPSIPAQELRSLKKYAFSHLPSDATPHGAGGTLPPNKITYKMSNKMYYYRPWVSPLRVRPRRNESIQGHRPRSSIQRPLASTRTMVGNLAIRSPR